MAISNRNGNAAGPEAFFGKGARTMSNHPTTFAAEPPHEHGTADWQDRATLHRRDAADGVLHGFKAIRQGTFAELVRFVALLAEDERSEYVIEKAGDRQYEPDEIARLYARDDFPKGN
jgi:hypothetical protein